MALSAAPVSLISPSCMHQPRCQSRGSSEAGQCGHPLSFLNVNTDGGALLPTSEGGPGEEEEGDNSITSLWSDHEEMIYVDGVFLAESDLPYQIGDLVWASANSCPYWPAIVCEEWSSGTFYRVRKSGLSSTLLFHVMYLCDKNRQNWVVRSKIERFDGQAKFMAWKKEKLANKKVKEAKKFEKLFNIGKSSKAFADAVETGERLLTKSREERSDLLLVRSSQDEAVSSSEEADSSEDEDDSGSGCDLMKPGPSRLPAPPNVAPQKMALSKPRTSTATSVNVRPVVQKFKKREECLCFVCEDWIHEDVDRRKGKPASAEPLPFGRTGVTCNSGCGKAYHRTCLLGLPSGSLGSRKREPNVSGTGEEPDEAQLRALDAYVCGECKAGVAECFICKKVDPLKTTAKVNRSKVAEEETGNQPKVTEKCANKNCEKRYHLECVSRPEWFQATLNDGKIHCPLHKCHTCTLVHADNPKASENPRKLLQCIRCPTAYHYGIECSPAGTHYLGGNYMICPKQHGVLEKSLHLNCSWCFMCSKGGGSLVCCDACPTSIHERCLTNPVSPTGTFLCEGCEEGRMPMHGDIVWAKMAHFRWWPSLVVHPDEVPSSVRAVEHSPGQFPVRFFGTGDHHWVDRLRVFLYEEGDSDCAGRSKAKGKALDQKFVEGLREAEEAYKSRRDHVEHMERAAEPGNGGRKCRPPPYTKILVNKPVGRVKQVHFSASEAQVCGCDPNGNDPCGVDSECLNRQLNVECHPTACPAGPRCGNQLFQRRTYPRMCPFPISGKGWGLKAGQDIKEGTFVIEYVGELIDDEEYKSRVARKHTSKDQNYYFLTLDQNRIIDAGPKGNLARFMNHSCEPNCVTQKWEVAGDSRVGLFALKDIKEGEELTFNYHLESFCKSQKKVCECGAPSCSGYIGDKAKEPAVAPLKSAATVKRPPSKTAVAEKPKDKKSAIRSKLLSRGAVARGGSRGTTLHDAQCNYCGSSAGDLSLMMRCVDCPRSFHRKCLERDGFPWEAKDGSGRVIESWRCSRHVCDDASCVEDANEDKFACDHCPTSYCAAHGPKGGIVWLGKLGYVCPRHKGNSVEALVNYLTPEVVFGVSAKSSRKRGLGKENNN